jgi:putative ABC transport system substrate-binding protein
MVEGLESRLTVPVQRFFLDTHGRPYSLGGEADLNPRLFDVLVAVGPEALQYLCSLHTERPVVYGMVYNPDKVLVGYSLTPLCGVSLNIPAQIQLSTILRFLPSVKRLGVFFNPENNQTWFNSAQNSAGKLGFELVPLQINQQGGRLEIVGDFTGLNALLFIPDQSIISKAVIQYVIKQGVLHKIPVIGYNQFFYDSGAALGFLVNYRGVGEQVADQVESLLADNKCEGEVPPQFETLINKDVWQVLHIEDKKNGGNLSPDKE